MTPKIPKRKKIRIQKNSRLIMLGSDLANALIAMVRPYDLEMILSGLAILAIRRIFNAPRDLLAESP